MTDKVLIHARWVVPVEPAGVVLERHAVALRGGRIEAVLPMAEATQRYADYARVDLPGHALIPGLVNAHTHAAMALMRGIADDLPLMAWLQEHIWPAEAKHVSDEFVHDGSLLAMAEMLRGGGFDGGRRRGGCGDGRRCRRGRSRRGRRRGLGFVRSGATQHRGERGGTDKPLGVVADFHCFPP